MKQQEDDNLKNNNGFTLIELVVVVALLALFITLFIVPLNEILAKTRDTKRLSDLDRLKTALILYKFDHEHVPYVYLSYNWRFFHDDIVGYFTGSFPEDPKNNLSHNYIYCTNSETDKHLLAVRLEKTPKVLGIAGFVNYSLDECISSAPEASHLRPLCDGDKNYCLGDLN
ncbi:prepilin-type N-terminal cleavage/methylation domain-containing protein [Patescibacteria group bacterium]|nr:prepilin-type N-terminal cleavage/methylation domain-containing protein [Patescibacteria group bacterium]